MEWNDQTWSVVREEREMKGQNSQLKWIFEIIYVCAYLFYIQWFKIFQIEHNCGFIYFHSHLEYVLPLFLTYESLFSELNSEAFFNWYIFGLHIKVKEDQGNAQYCL